MDFQLGDDGELVPIEVEGKSKRKKKASERGLLRAFGQIVLLTLFFSLGSVGGFASYLVRNPNNRFNSPGANTGNYCTPYIKSMSVADASVFFQGANGHNPQARMLIGMDGHRTSVIDRPGEVDALNLGQDGKHVVESRYVNIDPYFLIYTWELSDLAEWNEQIVTDGKYPAWSPDIHQIVYFKFKGSDRSGLYVMSADGSNNRLLRKTWTVHAPVSWSPDGTQVVLSTSDYNETVQNLYIINIKDGTEQTLIKSGISAEFPAWSPDGKRIAYISHDVYTVSVDGSLRRNLTNSQFSYIASVGWSPDSQNIAFLATDSGGKQGIYVMDADGAGLHSIYKSCP
jgi:Tol biopolymer transport system component